MKFFNLIVRFFEINPISKPTGVRSVKLRAYKYSRLVNHFFVLYMSRVVIVDLSWLSRHSQSFCFVVCEVRVANNLWIILDKSNKIPPSMTSLHCSKITNKWKSKKQVLKITYGLFSLCSRSFCYADGKLVMILGIHGLLSILLVQPSPCKETSN